MTDELRDLEPNTNLAKFDDLNNFQDIENYFRMMRNQNTCNILPKQDFMTKFKVIIKMLSFKQANPSEDLTKITNQDEVNENNVKISRDKNKQKIKELKNFALEIQHIEDSLPKSEFENLLNVLNDFKLAILEQKSNEKINLKEISIKLKAFQNFDHNLETENYIEKMDFTSTIENLLCKHQRTINRIKGFNFHKILFNQNIEEKYLPNDISGNKKIDLENVSKFQQHVSKDEQNIFKQNLENNFHLEIKNIQESLPKTIFSFRSFDEHNQSKESSKQKPHNDNLNDNTRFFKITINIDKNSAILNRLKIDNSTKNSINLDINLAKNKLTCLSIFKMLECEFSSMANVTKLYYYDIKILNKYLNENYKSILNLI